MKERPILFSAPMVRALLDGSKTQTRRTVKPAPMMIKDQRTTPFDGEAVELMSLLEQSGKRCPYGQPGDRLWARENFQPFLNDDCDGDMRLANWKTGENYHCSFPATDGIHEFMDAEDNLKSSVKPSIHMPRWASRITLEVTGVRVERLQDISEADAIAEGIAVTSNGCYHCGFDELGEIECRSPVTAYAWLWNSINGPGSWAENPWVWVIEFKAVTL